MTSIRLPRLLKRLPLQLPEGLRLRAIALHVRHDHQRRAMIQLRKERNGAADLAGSNGQAKVARRSDRGDLLPEPSYS